MLHGQMIANHRTGGAAGCFNVSYLSPLKLQRMKRSARVASILIILFFLFFNGLQVYLIVERVADSKTRFRNECTSVLLSTLNEYTKLHAIDSASTPGHALIAYSPKKIEINRPDSQTVTFNAPSSSVATDTVDHPFVEAILNTRLFRTIDMKTFDSLFKKALDTKIINAEYRLDTITIPGRRLERPLMQRLLNRKRNKDFPYSSSPMRTPYNSTIFIFAEFKTDRSFFINDLLWSMLAFALILLIGNTALVFVYKTIRKQKRINELKTDFINNITHEMKTPITIASAGLQALEHHVPDTERANFYLDTSKRQLHLLNDFVERILDSAVQDVSDFILKKEKIDLHALFGELVASHSVFQGKSVNFDLTSEGSVFIHGDRLHLETAFHNIIDNAIKYSNGSVDIHIDIAENSRDCTIKIRDNGMGIPPQFIKNIFEKFFRVPKGDSQSIKGFGLGLYYVSIIVKKHAGNISVQSELQSGTEFIITLPKYA